MFVSRWNGKENVDWNEGQNRKFNGMNSQFTTKLEIFKLTVFGIFDQRNTTFHWFSPYRKNGANHPTATIMNLSTDPHQALKIRGKTSQDLFSDSACGMCRK